MNVYILVLQICRDHRHYHHEQQQQQQHRETCASVAVSPEIKLLPPLHSRRPK